MFDHSLRVGRTVKRMRARAARIDCAFSALDDTACARQVTQLMANVASFDITSGVDLQEVDNAVNQARKEIAQRYDFKGSRAAIELNRTENTLTLTADDDFKMTALWEILQGRLVRRGVPTIAGSSNTLAANSAWSWWINQLPSGPGSVSWKRSMAA